MPRKVALCEQIICRRLFCSVFAAGCIILRWKSLLHDLLTGRVRVKV
jgi:hypothetical protein